MVHNSTAAPQVKLTHEFMWRSWKTVGSRGSWPSTGWVGLWMAVAVAREIGANGALAILLRMANQPLITRHFPLTVSVYGYGACGSCIRYYDCTGSNSTARAVPSCLPHLFIEADRYNHLS